MMKIRKSKAPPFGFGCFYPFFEGPLLIKSTPYDHVLTNSFWKSSFWEQNKSHFALPEAIPWFGPEILQVSKKSKDLMSIRSNLVKMTTDCQDHPFRFLLFYPFWGGRFWSNLHLMIMFNEFVFKFFLEALINLTGNPYCFHRFFWKFWKCWQRLTQIDRHDLRLRNGLTDIWQTFFC